MAASLNENLPSRSVRIPFHISRPVSRWRVVFRNANYRANLKYPGAVTIRTVTVGDAVMGPDGSPTGAFGDGSESFPDGMRVNRYDDLIKDLGEEEWTTEWFDNPLIPGSTYLLSYGFRTNRQTIHRGIAGGWWTAGSPLNAELRLDPSASRTKRPPLDVRIEADTAGPVQTLLVVGDSIAAGSSATFPTLEAPTALAARGAPRHAVPILHTFGGATLSEWTGSWSDRHSMKWRDVLRYGPHSAAIISLGSNDIHAGKSLARLQSTLTTLVDLVGERDTDHIFVCTVPPRISWGASEPDKESVRRAFNDWLADLPEGIAGCVDTAAAVTDHSGASPQLELTDSDGIHFNTAGSTHMAKRIRDTLARP